MQGSTYDGAGRDLSDPFGHYKGRSKHQEYAEVAYYSYSIICPNALTLILKAPVVVALPKSGVTQGSGLLRDLHLTLLTELRTMQC